MPERPTVSVILTVFNGEQFLPLAIESILGQTFQDFELIIVDDGSTDSSATQLRGINDARVRVIRNPANQGQPAALKIGINAAIGGFCALHEQDDISLPARLERQGAYLGSHPGVGMVGSAVEDIDASGKVLKTAKMPEDFIAIRWMGLLECPMRQPTLCGRTELMQQHICSAESSYYHDWDFIMRVARESEVYNLPETLVQYRRHSTNTSKLYKAQFDEIGIDIALREIRAGFPDFPISRDEVANMRWVLFGAGQRAGKSLAMTRRVLSQYRELQQAFQNKYQRIALPHGPS